MKQITLIVFNIVGSSFCVGTDDGNKVFELIKKGIKENVKIKISFQNIDMITSAFLNSAIGQLYRDFTEEEIKKHITFENLAKEDIVLLKRVINTAKLYYSDPKSMETSIKEILS